MRWSTPEPAASATVCSPRGGIEFDIDPATPQIAAARINLKGELVVAYAGLGEGGTTDATMHLYAFDSRGFQQLLDRGPSSKLPVKSVKLNGEDVSWTHDGITRTAKIGVVLEHHRRRRPGFRHGHHVARRRHRLPDRTRRRRGALHRLLDPGAGAIVTATAPPGTPVTISGACTATHVPVVGEPSSTAQCNVLMSGPQTANVTFG